MPDNPNINRDQLLLALARAESLPSNWYTDPQITELETQKIFRRTWQYLGHKNRLKNIGDYITGYVGEIPVVAVRDQDGELNGFINVCRHRRHEVMQGCGNAKIMQCPYHAWTYDLKGELKAAPRSEREANFSKADYPLLSLKIDLLGPWVFANADPDCKPIATYYGKVLDKIAETGIDLDSMELYSRTEWESHSNWKTMLENFLECYHCPVAHPGFSAVINVDQDSYRLESQEWFSSQIAHAKNADAAGSITQAQFHLLFPNFTININPGFPNVSVDVSHPHGPNATRGVTEQYFAPGVDRKWVEELMAFNKEVGAEDDVLTDSVQRGLRAGIPATGRLLANSEHLALHFQKLVVELVCAKP